MSNSYSITGFIDLKLAEWFCNIDELLRNNLISLVDLDWEYLKNVPTLESGHTSNKIYDDGVWQVWGSRLFIGDYFDCEPNANQADSRLLFFENHSKGELKTYIRICGGRLDRFHSYRLKIQRQEKGY